MTILSSFSRLGGQLMLSPQGQIGTVSDQGEFSADAELNHLFGSYTVQYLQAYRASPNDHRFRIGLVYHTREPRQWGTETMVFADTLVRTLYPVSGVGQSALTAFQQKKRENSVYYGTGILLEYALKDAPEVPIYIPVLFDLGTRLGDYAAQFSDLLKNENPDTPVLEVLNIIGPSSGSRKNTEAFNAIRGRLTRAIVNKGARKSLEQKLAEGMRASGIGASAPTSPTVTSVPGGGGAVVPTLNPNKSSAQWYAAHLHDKTCQQLAAYLRQPREYAEPDQLRQFARLRELDVDQLRELAASCPLYAAPPGAALLDRGTADQWNLYLLRGEVQLTAADGDKKAVSAETANAASAIATLKPRKFNVASLTPVIFLWIHDSIIADIQQRRPSSPYSLV